MEKELDELLARFDREEIARQKRIQEAFEEMKKAREELKRILS